MAVTGGPDLVRFAMSKEILQICRSGEEKGQESNQQHEAKRAVFKISGFQIPASL